MSAYIVSDAHINALVSYASSADVRYTYNGETIRIRGREAETASLLYIANVESVNSRYNECEPSDGFRFRMSIKPRPALHIVKACNCFDYQACEVENYGDTIAAKITSAIRDDACRDLPGYDDAPWGFDD